MTTDNLEPMVYSINDALRLSTFGRTRLYQLINSGELKVTRIGRRTLVRADSLRALITPED
ncbi:MAG: helix-turn-helix domain-containing protein [Croceibacterium sp.]